MTLRYILKAASSIKSLYLAMLFITPVTLMGYGGESN